MKIVRFIFWSLLSLIITSLIILWFRSHSVSDGIYHSSGTGRELHVYACQGTLNWRVLSHKSFTFPITKYYSFEVHPSPPNFYTEAYLPSHHSFLKNYVIFRYGPDTEIIPIDAGPDVLGAVGLAFGKCLEVPIWAILILALLPIGYLGIQRTRRCRALAQRHCEKCSYDLRAHKPGDKCPECGTTIPQPPAQQETPT